MGHSIYDPGQDCRLAWNAGRKLGAKRPLQPKQVWAVRFWLEQERRFRAATIFLWLGRSQVGPAYKTALTISGLVTFIAAYHYWRIFESWEGAYEVRNGIVAVTGLAFNDA